MRVYEDLRIFVVIKSNLFTYIMIYYVIVCALGVALGGLIVAVWMNNAKSRLNGEVAMLKGELRQKDVQIDQMNERLIDERKQYDSALERRQKEYEMQQQLAQRQLEAADQRQREADRLMAERFQKMKEEFQTASEGVLRTRQQQLEKTGRDTLQGIADPLLTEIKRMQTLVGETDREHQKAIAQLHAAIKENMEQSKGLGEKADSLAEALRGENKTQGNFGEMRLTQLLDNMGFTNGEQYTLQPIIKAPNGKPVKTADGHSLQPDVILHFPEHRDLIIDSKVSLTAFQDYYEAKTEAEKKSALDRHLKSMRNHVDELAKKDYASYLPAGGVDFVIMFVFNEAAVQLALTADPSLYEEAWRKKVIICSGSNLYGLLRLLESAWKQQRRLENEQQLMAAARLVVERVQIFRERFENVENLINKTQKAVEEVKNITEQRGHSIITATRKMLKFGAEQSAKHVPLPAPDNDEDTDNEDATAGGQEA